MSTDLITGEKLVTSSSTHLNPDGSRDEDFEANAGPLTSQLVRSAPT